MNLRDGTIGKEKSAVEKHQQALLLLAGKWCTTSMLFIIIYCAGYLSTCSCFLLVPDETLSSITWLFYITWTCFCIKLSVKWCNTNANFKKNYKVQEKYSLCLPNHKYLIVLIPLTFLAWHVVALYFDLFVFVQ